MITDPFRSHSTDREQTAAHTLGSVDSFCALVGVLGDALVVNVNGPKNVDDMYSISNSLIHFAVTNTVGCLRDVDDEIRRQNQKITDKFSQKRLHWGRHCDDLSIELERLVRFSPWHVVRLADKSV